MRYPASHKEETRKRILTEASALFRRQGSQSTGLPNVMKAAGMTVGGFYRHFDSKSDLFREVVKNSLKRTLAFLQHSPAHHRGRRWLREAAARYLSREHLDNVARGCPLPSLTPEIARAAPEVREAYDEALREIVDELESRMPEGDGGSRRERAWGFMALNVGGLMLARGSDDPDLAEEILRACRKTVASGDPSDPQGLSDERCGPGSPQRQPRSGICRNGDVE